MPNAVAADGRVPWLSMWFCLAVAVGVVRGQDAPPDLTPAIRTAQQISDEQQRAIGAYVSYWSKRLASGDRIAVAEAKDKLSSVLDINPSKAFRDAYSQALGPALTEAAGHANAQARLSAMIIAAGASTGAVAGPCAQGLKDANLGVRYHAARAVADIFERRDLAQPPPFNEAQQRQVFEALRTAMATEDSEIVFQQMARAISRLTLPEAFAESLRLLDQRLLWLREHPAEAPRAAGDVLSNLLIQLNEQVAMNRDVTGPLRDLTAAAGRYLRLLAERINSDGLSGDEMQQGWAELIDIVEEQVFKRAVSALDSTVQGPSLTRHIRSREWGDPMAKDILRWIGEPDRPGLLTTSGIAIPLERLLLPAAPAGAAAGR